jgi:hypothetical protein
LPPVPICTGDTCNAPPPLRSRSHGNAYFLGRTQVSKVLLAPAGRPSPPADPVYASLSRSTPGMQAYTLPIYHRQGIG